MTQQCEILQITRYADWIEAELNAAFRVHVWPAEAAGRDRLLREHGHRIQGIATSSRGVIDAALIERLPALRIIACSSAGLERIDRRTAESRGIRITSAGPMLAGDVADTAFGLILALGRGLLRADAFVRAGRWPAEAFPEFHSLDGRKLGILGLGHIGSAVARRAEAFGMTVGYTGRRPKPEAPYPFLADARALAGWADMLVVSCPGGPETRGLVGAAVLEALGPEGFLINVARGSVVDEPALVRALETGVIAGAGLDVFAQEPHVPPALLASDRVVLLPHIGSGTFECERRQGRAILEALRSALLPG